MTHFTIGIIISRTCGDIDGFIHQQMEGFDENLPVRPYVCYTVEQARRELENEIRSVVRMIASGSTVHHIDRCRKSLDQLMATTPERRYRQFIDKHDHFNHAGEPTSTYNPEGKWDRYHISDENRHWSHDSESSADVFAETAVSTDDARSCQTLPDALITPDGQWHASEQTHGVRPDSCCEAAAAWRTLADAILREHPAHNLILVDAYI